MQYRSYGTTGKKISILSLGGMRYAEPQNIEKMAQIPLEAAKLGVNYFDTAPWYSEDKSEDILGTAVLEMRRLKLPYYISSKSGAATPDEFWKNLERSLKRLNVEAIDFYHSWGVNTPEIFRTRKGNKVIEAFFKAKEQKLVRHVVASTHMSGQGIKDLMAENIFDGYTLGFCAINFPFRVEALHEAGKRKLGVVTMNPLGGGMIPEHADRFGFIRTRPDQNIIEAALHFNLAHAQITSVLVGFRTVEDVRSAVKAVESFTPISESEISRMRANIEEQFNELCTTCLYCDGCPQGIPVHMHMEAYNHLLLNGKNPEKYMNRMKWHWNEEHYATLENCTECGECEKKCTQKLPIIERLKDIKRFTKAGKC